MKDQGHLANQTVQKLRKTILEIPNHNMKERPGAPGQPDGPPHAAARRQDGQGSADQGDLLNNINFDHFHEMIIKTVFK